jgi:hypothetical protein
MRWTAEHNLQLAKQMVCVVSVKRTLSCADARPSMMAFAFDTSVAMLFHAQSGTNSLSRWSFPALIVGLAVCSSAMAAEPPKRGLHTVFLMTLRAPLDPAIQINDSLAISNVSSTGGLVRGPRIKGVLVPPGGDWSRVLPSGVLRLDVRLTIKTDDGALIYVSYNGVERDSPVSEQKSNAEQHVIGPEDVSVWMIAPTFETSAPRYAWLNETQAVGKMVEFKDGPGGYVKYEIYEVN